MESQARRKEHVGFDAAHRADDAAVAAALKTISESPVMSAVLDAAGTDMFVLNRQLQVVASNSRAAAGIDMAYPAEAMGRRIGEVYGCVNAAVSPEGCGAADPCDYCGALKVILSSLETGQTVSGECLMRTRTTTGTGAGEYDVTATPIKMGDERFVVVALNDLSDKKRRELLERLFVHDLKNALTGLIGWSELLAENPADDAETTASRIGALARNIGEEIETHRLLMMAEQKQFAATFQDVAAADILVPLKSLFSRHEVAYAKHVVMPDPVPSRVLHTDPAVLRRVLINMMMNALEATPKNGTIRLDFVETAKGVTFSVWNEGVIPSDIAAHIFKRSFSTKAAAGRGLGTYSMKIFGEDVLGGKVSFSSEAGNGTVFRLTLS